MIHLPFLGGCFTSRNKPNCLLSFRVNHHDDNLNSTDLSDGDISFFYVRMQFIENFNSELVLKHAGGSFKVNSMLGDVDLLFMIVPLKNHVMNPGAGVTVGMNPFNLSNT